MSVLTGEVFDTAPPIFVGLALLIMAAGWFVNQYRKAAEARTATAKVDAMEDEHEAELSKVKHEVQGLREEITKLRADYDGEIKRLQDLLLAEQREAYRLRGLLTAAGLDY